MALKGSNFFPNFLVKRIEAVVDKGRGEGEGEGVRNVRGDEGGRTMRRGIRIFITEEHLTNK